MMMLNLYYALVSLTTLMLTVSAVPQWNYDRRHEFVGYADRYDPTTTPTAILSDPNYEQIRILKDSMEVHKKTIETIIDQNEKYEAKVRELIWETQQKIENQNTMRLILVFFSGFVACCCLSRLINCIGPLISLALEMKRRKHAIADNQMTAVMVQNRN